MPMPVDFTKSAFHLKERLTKTLPRVYETNYSQMWGLNPALNFHRATGDLPFGLEYIEAWTKENLGQIPVLYDGNADDIPIVDVQIGKKSYKAALFALANEWNLLDIEKQRLAEQLGSNMPNLDLVSTKQDAVADFFNRGEHYTVLYGYPKVGIRGIFSQTGISNVDAGWQPYKKVNGAYVISTEQLLEDLIDIIWTFIDRAKLTSAAQISIKIPLRLSRRLLERVESGTTLNQMLRSVEIGLGISSIDVHIELSGVELNKYVPNESGTGFYPTNRDRIVFKSTTETPERHFYPRRPFTPFQRSTLRYEQVYISGTTGVINLRPENMWYYDFDNSLV